MEAINKYKVEPKAKEYPESKYGPRTHSNIISIVPPKPTDEEIFEKALTKPPPWRLRRRSGDMSYPGILHLYGYWNHKLKRWDNAKFFIDKMEGYRKSRRMSFQLATFKIYGRRGFFDARYRKGKKVR